MEADKKPADEKPAEDKPAESKTLEQGKDGVPAHNALDQPTEDQANADGTGDGDKKTDAKPAKSPGPLKKLLKKFNLYLILFVLVSVIGAGITLYAYVSGKKPPASVTVGSQQLTTSQLKQLADANATVGGSGETVTVQGNAVFSGQVLVRSNLDVAGTIQLGGQLSLPQLSVSGSSNLNSAQINSLQVSNATIFKAPVTVQNGINVSGSSSFGGPVTAPQITVADLDDVGQQQADGELIGLNVPGHIIFASSTTPHISYLSSLGGGSASISGGDTTGTVTINAGGGASAGCLVQVTFSKPYTSTSVPNVILTPISPSGTPLSLESYAGNVSKTGFSVCAVTPPRSTQFAVSYFITSSQS